MSFPPTDTIIAFVVFFFPGFTTLILVCISCKVSFKDRSDLEKILLSSIFSVISFLLIGVPPQAESILNAIFNVETILKVFGISVILALAIISIIILGRWFVDLTSVKFQNLWGILGGTHRSKKKISKFILRQLFDAREKNELIVKTTSGEIYKGSLHGYTADPLEIVLLQTQNIPIMKYDNKIWKEIEEYLVIFKEKDIIRISVQGV